MLQKTLATILAISILAISPNLSSSFAQSDLRKDPLATAEQADEVIRLWPAAPPGQARKLDAEKDFTKPSDKLIAGKRIIKLGNVTTPELHVFHPPTELKNGASVVICPGGGFHILAWDLEGTEVAKWLNSLGVTAIVLKYRVPTRDQDPYWKPAVQDAQRAMSFVRSQANEWKLDTKRIGILGFSAGGMTAAYTSYGKERVYETIDKIDETPFRPDFAILIYAAGMANEKGGLSSDLNVHAKSPPAFMAHAFDDFVKIENCLEMMKALKTAKVSSELHIYDRGGHGYGLREKGDEPVTTWAARCGEWMSASGILTK